MKSSIINLYIENGLSGIELHKTIEKEVAEYCESMAKIGSTLNLYFSEDETIYFDRLAIVKLLGEVINGNLSPQVLAYICDCFTLGDRIEYQNELIKDVIFQIAGPEINGGFKSDSELQEHLQKIVTGD
ncbi:hypothetical protein [Pedobacter sp. R20-19]|uniref:hypothetical protein n=1 Tax=Pedobacter sp. R20-19 TaxID=1270196 RepID=UPI0004931ACA|nr:hypothetical protein [Pedobacter sp. R20-19]